MRGISYVVMLAGIAFFIGGFINGPSGGLAFFAVGIGLFIGGVLILQADEISQKLRADSEEDEEEINLQCPNCEATVYEEDKICELCGQDLLPKKTKSKNHNSDQTSSVSPENKLCPKCGEPTVEEASFCMKCGEKFPQPEYN